MKPSSLLLGLALLPAFGPGARGAELPKSIDSAPCQAAPTIDGDIGAREWREAPALKFEIPFVRISPPHTETRACELRVMNSADALYVAFVVPDQTVDQSLSPMLIDAAMLAFGQGEQVRAGDDRKIIGPGFYRDKSVNGPGQGDRDDPHQDGLGAMKRQNGTCSFEWAVPLNVADTNDLRAKPGESVRFNLVYFDAFQIPLTKVVLGGAHGIRLDRAKEWGSIQLAANVKDDDGAAFQGPAWVKPLFATLRSGPASRLRLTEAVSVPGASPPAKALLTFTYRNERGEEVEGKAKLFLPQSIRAEKSSPIPLLFTAGYELADGGAEPFLKRGWIVASPRDLGANPLVRTSNPDIALLHIVRALPFVDDSRVIVAGGSAGGWMTLLLAAETFPLAGAAPDVPPVNWGYNAAYFFNQKEKAGPQGGGTPKLPVLFSVMSLLEGCRPVYGGEYGDATWFAHSPIAHVPTITCPVSVYWSTADVLVPMNQVGSRWVQPFAKPPFPAGFTMDPAALLKSREGRLTLMDVLPASDYEVFNLTVPPGTPGAGAPAGSGTLAISELPLSADKPWSIGILDEGPPEPALGHRKSSMILTRNAFFNHVVSGKIAARQLTTAKLERLMDRYAGKEWLPSRLVHLDLPESERADVLRGLKTYVASAPQNARTFAELYSQLPRTRQVLEPDVLKSLSGTKAH